MLCELLAADIEGVEGIGAIGTVFEKAFVLTKKVQMKLCVTGDDADGCAAGDAGKDKHREVGKHFKIRY